MPADSLGLHKAHVARLSRRRRRMRRCDSGKCSRRWKKRRLVSAVIPPLLFSGRFGKLVYLQMDVFLRRWVGSVGSTNCSSLLNHKFFYYCFRSVDQQGCFVCLASFRSCSGGPVVGVTLS